MNSVIWSIVMINLVYGTSNTEPGVMFATKEGCEQILLVRKPSNEKSKHLTYRCVQTVIPAIGMMK